MTLIGIEISIAKGIPMQSCSKYDVTWFHCLAMKILAVPVAFVNQIPLVVKVSTHASQLQLSSSQPRALVW